MDFYCLSEKSKRKDWWQLNELEFWELKKDWEGKEIKRVKVEIWISKDIINGTRASGVERWYYRAYKNVLKML